MFRPCIGYGNLPHFLQNDTSHFLCFSSTLRCRYTGRTKPSGYQYPRDNIIEYFPKEFSWYEIQHFISYSYDILNRVISRCNLNIEQLSHNLVFVFSTAHNPPQHHWIQKECLTPCIHQGALEFLVVVETYSTWYHFWSTLALKLIFKVARVCILVTYADRQRIDR